MTFRGAFAGLVAAVLLALSTAASECQVECDLSSMTPSCHARASQAREHQAMPPMAGMDRMHHANGVQSAAQQQVAVAANAGCATHVCSELPAKVSELKAFSHEFVSTALVFQVATQVFSEPSRGKPLSRGPPGLRRTTPVTLRTTLQV